mgnify:CR=1 FL=1
MLDQQQTMQRYKTRLRNLPLNLFQTWFEGKWISSFAIRSTVTAGHFVGDRMKKQYPVQAYLIALERGVHPLGLTTEHTQNNQFICAIRQLIPNDQICYIGKYSHFSGHTLKRKENPFALQPVDKCYHDPATRPICIPYNLRQNASLHSTS